MLHVAAPPSCYSSFPFIQIPSSSFPRTKNASALFFTSISRRLGRLLSLFLHSHSPVCLFVALLLFFFFLRMSCASFCLFRGSITVTADQLLAVTSLINNKIGLVLHVILGHQKARRSFRERDIDIERERERESFIPRESERQLSREREREMGDALWCHFSSVWRNILNILCGLDFWVHVKSTWMPYLWFVSLLSVVFLPMEERSMWNQANSDGGSHAGLPWLTLHRRAGNHHSSAASPFLLTSVAFLSDTHTHKKITPWLNNCVETVCVVLEITRFRFYV